MFRFLGKWDLAKRDVREKLRFDDAILSQFPNTSALDMT